jgi:hypothetical protein
MGKQNEAGEKASTYSNLVGPRAGSSGSNAAAIEARTYPDALGHRVP